MIYGKCTMVTIYRFPYFGVVGSNTDEDMPPEATQVAHKHIYEGPITRNLVKILQKEVNSLLFETNFNIFENIILPKCSTLILLRHVHKEDWNTKQSDNQFTSTSSDPQIGTTRSDQPVRTTKRNTHNS